jgi:hypothetical protein
VGDTAAHPPAAYNPAADGQPQNACIVIGQRIGPSHGHPHLRRTQANLPQIYCTSEDKRSTFHEAPPDREATARSVGFRAAYLKLWGIR